MRFETVGGWLMKPNSPIPPDLFRESSAHKHYRRGPGRKPGENVQFCDQCSAPCLEEELHSGICVDCTRRQSRAY